MAFGSSPRAGDRLCAYTGGVSVLGVIPALGGNGLYCGVSARARCAGCYAPVGVGYGRQARTLLSVVSSRPSLALLFACAGAYMRPLASFGLCAYT